MVAHGRQLFQKVWQITDRNGVIVCVFNVCLVVEKYATEVRLSFEKNHGIFADEKSARFKKGAFKCLLTVLSGVLRCR